MINDVSIVTERDQVDSCPMRTVTLGVSYRYFRLEL